MDIREQSLVKRVKRRERIAQRELYDLYAGRLLSTAQRYVGRREVAEDILHDSFIKIFGAIDSFTYRGSGSLRAWMERITINCSLEWLRAQKRFETISFDDNISKIDGAEPSGEDVERVPQDVILRLISELPDGYRTVFNLYSIEGYSHRDIAQELGINEKSSSSQLLRAKRVLATKIKEYIRING